MKKKKKKEIGKCKDRKQGRKYEKKKERGRKEGIKEAEGEGGKGKSEPTRSHPRRISRRGSPRVHGHLGRQGERAGGYSLPATLLSDATGRVKDECLVVTLPDMKLRHLG